MFSRVLTDVRMKTPKCGAAGSRLGQAPRRPKHPFAAPPPTAAFGACSLELHWMLDGGAWMFRPVVPRCTSRCTSTAQKTPENIGLLYVVPKLHPRRREEKELGAESLSEVS